MAASNPTGPGVPTIKRLFAVSANRCAFPKCTAALVEGEKVVGKICHIKARSKGGPRYDPNQTAAERHGYYNLILMCGLHADVIDADEEAYTVQYLQRLKARHEQTASTMSDDDAEHGARLLMIDQPVFSTSQSGGITAHTVNVHNYPAPQPAPDDMKAPGFVAAKDGAARFRAPGEPLGTFWDIMPFGQDYGYEVFLVRGPAIWLRLMPRDNPSREWVHDELLRCSRGPSVSLQPLLWSSLQYLRAEDGIGAYSIIDDLKHETETASVAFAFNTGEIWCIDTSLLQNSRGKNLYFQAIARTLLQKFRGYGEFLKCLEIQPPFRWIAGLEGVKGWMLRTPPPPNHINISPGETCLNDIVCAEGSFDLQQPAAIALQPFFRELYRKCGMNIPEHIEELLRANRSF